MGIRWGALVVVLALLGGACASGGDEPEAAVVAAAPSPSPTATPEPALFPLCDAVPRIAAPEDWYRPEPFYFGDAPAHAIQDWAQDKPGYVTLWGDWERNGWVTVAFTSDAAARQAELEEAFPGVGVVAVEVDWTLADLDELRDRVFAALSAGDFGGGVGRNIWQGVVSVQLGVLTDERLALLEPLAGEAICVEGAPAEEAVPEGPQPTGGDGWRLLADEVFGPGGIRVATNAEQHDRFWAESGFPGAPPTVDFQSEIVIWFGASGGEEFCAVRLDGVIVDRDQALLHAHLVIPGNPVMCPGGEISHAFVVAVERSRLPEGPFAVQFDEQDPCAPPAAERILVDGDLTQPGAAVPDGAIAPDPAIVEQSSGFLEGDHGILEPDGVGLRYQLATACGIGELCWINGWVWLATETEVPPEWGDGDTVIVELSLSSEPLEITATANGRSVVYKPVVDPGGACP